jgi:maleylacetate reductase
MNPFSFEAHLPRVVFGPGRLASLADEVERLGARHALVLCTPEQRALADDAAARLGTRCAGVFDGAVMHVPIESARAARAQALALGADCAVAIGGGSTTGLGKAIALESGLPIVAVPTTYAGSEMTPIHGLTEGGEKKTGRDLRVLPRTVIYDPELTLSLPVGLSVTSGLNAIAHACEGLYANDANPIVSIMAEEGIRALSRALPRILSFPNDIEARGDALYGAWLCGSVLGHVAMGLHHKLCHTLGGSFDLPHAPTHTVVLPHAMAYNAAAAPEAMAAIARALRSDEAAPLALHRLATALRAPTSLREIGMPEEGLDRVADLAVSKPYPNPRPLEREPLRALLQRAWEGQSPRP